jgi:fructose-specific phosphotransferase system IIC component
LRAVFAPSGVAVIEDAVPADPAIAAGFVVAFLADFRFAFFLAAFLAGFFSDFLLPLLRTALLFFFFFAAFLPFLFLAMVGLR